MGGGGLARSEPGAAVRTLCSSRMRGTCSAGFRSILLFDRVACQVPGGQVSRVRRRCGLHADFFWYGRRERHTGRRERQNVRVEWHSRL